MGLTKKSWNSKRDWFQIFFTKNDSRWCSYSKYDCNYLTKAQKPFVLVIRYLTGPGHLGRQHDYDDDWDSCGVTSESLLQKRKVKSTKNVVTKKVKKPTQGNLIGSQIEMMKDPTQVINIRLELEKKSKPFSE